MSNKFYLFEGVDGVGKTSLAKALAEKINAKYYYSPPEVIRGMRKFADESSPEIQYQYYLWGNYIGSEEIAEIVKTQDAVVDYYVISTIVMYSLLLNKKLEFPDILMPDHIFYITASWEELEKRLNKRPERSRYENIEFMKEEAQ